MISINPELLRRALDGDNANIFMYIDGEWRTGMWTRIHAVELPETRKP